MERLEIDEIDQKGVVYLSSIVENFPALKELDLSIGFDFVRDDNTDTFRDFIDPDFEVKFPEADKTTITLRPEFDQEKQLRMFAPLNRFKRLRIQGVNKQGATYLNSIADELPLETSIALDSNDKNIELLSPMSSDNPFD